MYWGLILFRLLGRLVPLPVLAGGGRALATLAFVALPGKRASMRRNFRTVLDASLGAAPDELDRRARKLARRSMLAYGEHLLDFAGLSQLLPKVYADTVHAQGWEHLDRALADGRGAVFVSAHFGHWDLAGAALAKHCPPKSIYAVAEPFAHGRLDDVVTRERESYGLGIVPMDNVRQMARVLREGKVLGIVADRPVAPGDGIPVHFFGRRTELPAGAATLATLARCPILPGYLRKRGDGHFEGAILPPIEPIRTGNRTADLAATTQLVAEALEQIIRQSPHQWFMFRDMWPVDRESLPFQAVYARIVGVLARIRQSCAKVIVSGQSGFSVRPLRALLGSRFLDR